MKTYSLELQAALGFMVLQLLFKVAFELNGARTVQHLPVLPTVYFFVALLIAAIALSLLRLKIGYILGIVYGGLNIIAAAYMMVTNSMPSHSLLPPMNVAVASLFIAYFCILALKQTAAARRPIAQF